MDVGVGVWADIVVRRTDGLQFGKWEIWIVGLLMARRWMVVRQVLLIGSVTEICDISCPNIPTTHQKISHSVACQSSLSVLPLKPIQY